MAIYTVNEEFDYRLLAGSSCAFGVFDGLHIGHQYLLEQAMATKESGSGRAIAITFDIDPDELFRPDRLEKLMSNAERLDALSRSGVDDVVVLRFDENLFSKKPREFLSTAFPAGAPSHLHVGEDFRFGAKAAGTVEDLRTWGKSAGCEIHPHRLVTSGGKAVTSTRIRGLLRERRAEEARLLLGHAYSNTTNSSR